MAEDSKEFVPVGIGDEKNDLYAGVVVLEIRLLIRSQPGR
jgi:hypothetical protein